ncbi:MAG: hypothetical protein JNN08_30945 [Bryobacterales bacterium]|nr:hypothetical protein [Bryobacterales bacterium]
MISIPISAWSGFNVFTLQIDHLAEGLGAAVQVGWRFVSPNQDAAADVVAGKSGDQQPRVINLLRYAADDRPLQAVAAVQSLPELNESEYELRVLRIPGILLEAFWLVSAEGNRDLLVPVLTRSSRFKRMNAYPVTEFLKIARVLADEFLKFDHTEDV